MAKAKKAVAQNDDSQKVLREASKYLHALVKEVNPQKADEGFKLLGKGLSALGEKISLKSDNVDTRVTDALGEQLYALGNAVEDAMAPASRCIDVGETNANLADTLLSAALGVIELGDTIKSSKAIEEASDDPAKVLGCIDEVRAGCEQATEDMIMLAANAYMANGERIESIQVPTLGPNDLCGCKASPLKEIPPPIMLASVPVFDFPELIGANPEELEEILKTLLELLVLLAILLSFMPAVGCSRPCSEGDLRVTMLTPLSDAQGTSSFSLQWEYCCREACFLLYTGTYWNVEGTTQHTAGNPLGTNRQTAATRRAKQTGNAMANWLTNGGRIPPLVRRNRVRPTPVAPTSTC